ncbi:MAG TPA: bifunctional folylpolyglutamate synthase/dihydrofolate synthase, partial [Candidatus Choladousia intestinigallinarum]|nr:bifunctional folylpolyglutamate synthase/dihydrofolate synthase [Candidatus Choladousia intestinigallinarum]
RIFTVETPGNPRALPAGELARAVQRVNPSVEEAESIEDAVRKAFSLAGSEDVILIFGSLSFLGEARKAVEFISRR